MRILDTRDFINEGFINGAINIPLRSTFATWTGTLLKHDENLVILADEGKEKESIERLARIGYDNISGYLEGGFKTIKENAI